MYEIILVIVIIILAGIIKKVPVAQAAERLSSPERPSNDIIAKTKQTYYCIHQY